MKRVLWVEDNSDNLIEEKLFQNSESLIIESLDEAIDLVDKDLYDFDTIVLDIDFDKGIRDIGKIKDIFGGKLYLEEKDTSEMETYIHSHGGYLFYLYLLINGYPSDQVAFLTGNSLIKKELGIESEVSVEEVDDIINYVKYAWNGEDSDRFVDNMENAPINEKYKESRAIEEYYRALYNKDEKSLSELVKKIHKTIEDEASPKNIDTENTTDKLVRKFNEANLKLPQVIAKINIGDNYIAKKWLESKRTSDSITRWLAMNAAEFVSENVSMITDISWGKNSTCMKLQQEFDAAFKCILSMYAVLRQKSKENKYYQMISTLLVSYDSIPGKFYYNHSIPTKYEDKMKMFAVMSRKARDFCAHGQFDSSMSDETFRFILANIVLSLFPEDKICDMKIEDKSWFHYFGNILSETESDWMPLNEDQIQPVENIKKIQKFYDNEVRNNIDWSNSNTINKYVNIRNRSQILPTDKDYIDQNKDCSAIPYYKLITIMGDYSGYKNDDYYRFLITAYMVLRFQGKSYYEVGYEDTIGIIYRYANWNVYNWLKKNYPQT